MENRAVTKKAKILRAVTLGKFKYHHIYDFTYLNSELQRFIDNYKTKYFK